MKKAICLLLLFALCLLLSAPALAEDGPTVQVSPQKLVADGQSVKCEKYNIDGSNYFKLRDIARLMVGTPAAFGISFDAGNKAVYVVRGGEYESVGTELGGGGDRSESCVPSVWKLYVDGELKHVATYNIGGSNFYKLRDMGAVLGFAVDYDQASNTSFIYSDILRTAVTTLKEPFAEAVGWTFSAPAEQCPRTTYYAGGKDGEIVDGQTKATAPIITRYVEEDGLVTYTVRYEENGLFHLRGITGKDHFGRVSASYAFYDYYTGAVFRSRELGINDLYSDVMLVSYHGKTYPITYKLNIRDEGSYAIEGSNVTDTIKAYYSFTITVPQDYDGLVLAMECREPVFRNEAFPSGTTAGFTETHYWNDTEHMGDWVFIRPADWAVDLD